MSVIITGGNGFLGQRVMQELLHQVSAEETNFGGRKIIILDSAAGNTDSRNVAPAITQVFGDILDEHLLESILTKDVECIYHLAAVLSGGAEADFDLGMKVNLDGTRALLNACRKRGLCPRFVFASSIAVFGRGQDEAEDESIETEWSETSLPIPQSSYGAQKAMCELLISDASRKGFIDGVSLRMPTIAVRPGRPNSAASSFVSGIVREPMAGQHANCPVDPNLALWIQSPRMAVQNLLHAGTVDLKGKSRIVTLPGISTTPKEMVEAMSSLGGDSSLVTWDKQSNIERILSSWPGFIRTPRAVEMGFKADRNVLEVIKAYVVDDR